MQTKPAASVLLSHVDVRVRDRTAARLFYDGLLAPLGATRHDGHEFTTYQIVPDDMKSDENYESDDWFGLTQDANMRPNTNRIAFAASSRAIVDRVAEILPAIGAREIEGPDDAYGPDYYAVFFADPDGNPLEVCYIGDAR
ncbi:MAG: glyoxalase [Candidatus Eremiobacter antarcticus]|nr:VOC family protein [Candidatus Eremiobacteraeota bacterium]MBC5807692.1 VOC family protein [Candidatus Eremiobacteraeota bacterium]PZR60487.1 MAG: glyoxalase [Candidatus Eremiobacter sp. RRmetagenome_bin22]